MGLWMGVFAFSLVLTIIALLYLVRAFHRFYFLKELGENKKALSYFLSLLPVVGLLVFTFYKPVMGAIIIVHLLVFWLLADGLGKLVKRKGKVYWQGILAIASCSLYLAIGWHFAHHVVETRYEVKTEKHLSAPLRLVLLADSHLGSTFDGEGFARHLQKVQDSEPDLVVMVGDFVDDDSTRRDMEISCKALGELKTTYGVYFVFGNHDRGYGRSRDFNADDLVTCLKENGITVLEDEMLPLTETVSLLGRKDRYDFSRASMEELMEGVGENQFVICLDHQPGDYKAQEEAKVDLVLSGHTHGGQMVPIGLIGEIFGSNDKTYGMEKRGDTTFIVTSGISDWAIPFKTGTVAEYVVVDIEGEA